MKRLSRRTFLRGAGAAAIALPFLEEMTPARANPGDPPPTRVVTLFFGLGLDPAWQRDFRGALEPLAPFADRLTVASVNARQGTHGGAHCNTSAVIFVGDEARNVNVAGGPSIDQRVRRALDPAAPVLASGLWWRRGACDAQALRVFNADGSPRSPIKRPSEVFDRLFAGGGEPRPPSPDDEATRRARRVQRSVLDTVLEDYRHYTGERSPLGAASRLKLEQHLTSIREVERELAPADDTIDEGTVDEGDVAGCEAPTRPGDPDIADYDRFTYGTGTSAPTIDWQDVQRVFRLHADLWAIALRCDLVRYGNLMFESAGGHTNLRGTYRALGRSTDFPGTSQHDSYFHGGQRDHAELYQHLALSNLAYFLDALDDRDHVEANGQTVLDNTCVLIGTEYGWNHSKTDVFHAIVGAGGRFDPGFHVDRTLNCVDLYNAVCTAYDVPAEVGEATGVDSEGDGTALLA